MDATDNSAWSTGSGTICGSPTSTESSAIAYSGIPSSQIEPVFRLACKLRHSNPQASEIIVATKTALGVDIVSEFVDGALRLLPPSSDPTEVARRTTQARVRTEQALQAEAAFVANVRTVRPDLMDDAQQDSKIRGALAQGRRDVTRLKPDILFPIETKICGVLCNWIEYKDKFGFKDDPFVHKKNLKQYGKYAATFGSGMVVYRFGFETDLFSVEGVTCFREAEIADWITCTQMATLCLE